MYESIFDLEPTTQPLIPLTGEDAQQAGRLNVVCLKTVNRSLRPAA